MANVSPPPLNEPVIDKMKLALVNAWLRWINELYLWITGFSIQTVNVTLSAASLGTTTVSNQSWVITTSVISASVGLPTGMSVATFTALFPRAVISNISAGTFKVNVITSSNTTATFPVAVTGHK